MTEPHVPWLTDEEQHLWRSMLRFHNELSTVLSRQIQSENKLSLQDFEVLVFLSEAEEGKMRVTTLADQMLWERSRLSHQVSRMQTRGLVSRCDDPMDKRASVVYMTDAGRSAIEKAAPGHVRTVQKNLFRHLAEGDLEALTVIYDRLLTELHEENPDLPALWDESTSNGQR